MASDFHQHDLAARIQNAAHAGIVKRLSNEIDEEDRFRWENDNLSIMKNLLKEKASTCPEFRECLLEQKDKILAESTYNKRWGTGLNKWVTEATKPDFWPGNNMLGVMLMELTEELTTSPVLAPTEEAVMSADEAVADSANTADEEDEDEQEDAESADDQAITTDIQSIGRQQTQTPDATTRSKKKSKRRAKAKDSESGKNRVNADNRDTPKSKDRSERETETDSSIKTNPMDIRLYMDPLTGKRKSPETTPEKQEHTKKHVA